MTASKPSGLIYTFYSYKGGVGRSMALANVATLLSQAGRKVLMVDFDLEAPGLERYFRDLGAMDRRRSTIGITELVLSYADGTKIDWRTALIQLDKLSTTDKTAPHQADFHLISASCRGAPKEHPSSKTAKQSRAQSIEWGPLFSEKKIGDYLKELRNEWKQSYDIILIDSRTGISDIGGICTIILPDVLVLLFTANSQSVEGCIEVIRAARIEQEQLPEERPKLIALPILARDDRTTEYEQSREWRERISQEMADFFGDWLPRGTTASTVLQRLYIPHVPYWSFGERRPVVERPEELEDPGTLSSAYGRVASLIGSGLDWSLFEKTASEASRIAALNELQRLKSEARSLQIANRALEGDVAEVKVEADRTERLLEEAKAAIQQRDQLIQRFDRITGIVKSFANWTVALGATAGLLAFFTLPRLEPERTQLFSYVAKLLGGP